MVITADKNVKNHALSSLFAATIWLWWRKHRKGLALLAAYIVGLGIAVNTHAAGFTYLLVAASGMSFGLVYLFGTFTGTDTDIAHEGSTFPQYMLRLPASPHTLIAWPMLGGAVTMFCVWMLLCRSVIEPLGFHVHMVAAGAAIAVALVWTQALCWLPIAVGPVRIFLTLAALIAVTTLASLGGVLGMGLPAWLSCDAALIAMAYSLATNGLVKARQGDTVLSRRSHKAIENAPILRRPRFASSLRAQMWFEWRRHGPFPALLMLSIQLFLLPFLFTGTPTTLDPLDMMKASNQGIFSIQVQPGVMVELYLLAMTILFLGSWTNTPEERRRIDSAFYRSRPVRDTEMVVAFVKTSLFRGLACWSVCTIFVMLTLLSPAEYHGVHATFGSLLVPYITGQGLRTLLAVIIVALVLSFKAQTDALYDTLSADNRIQMIAAALSGFLMITPVCLLPVLAVTRPALFQHLLTMMPEAIEVLATAKIICVAVVLAQLRIRNLLSAKALSRIGAMWVAGYLSLCALLLILAGNVILQAQSMCALLLIMPGVRFGLAVITLNRNRHR